MYTYPYNKRNNNDNIEAQHNTKQLLTKFAHAHAHSSGGRTYQVQQNLYHNYTSTLDTIDSSNYVLLLLHQYFIVQLSCILVE
jgi:hypothetical protein